MQRRDTAIQLIGVISDTHGLLRQQAFDALQGSDLILHAGDVGRVEVLQALQTIAPVVAVRGNIDRGRWADDLPDTQLIGIGGVTIYMLHDVKDLGDDAAIAGVKVIVSGHSHKPRIEERDSRLFVNPGSAGPRRFKLPVTVARMVINSGEPQAEVIKLSV